MEYTLIIQGLVIIMYVIKIVSCIDRQLIDRPLELRDEARELAGQGVMGGVMKKVFVKAYTENNLGDDLFVYMLAKRYPNCEFLVPCSIRYRKPFRAVENITFVPIIPFIDGVLSRMGISLRVKRNYYRKLMAECDATIHIGGSLFIEYMFPHAEIAQYARDIQASQSYYLLGSNFGPFETEAFYEQVHQLFAQMDDVCVRDDYTYQLFKDLDTVRLAPDIVFGLEPKAYLVESKSKQERIVISVIRLKGRPGLEEVQELYEDKIRQLTLALIDEGYEVVLMSFCRAEGDEEVIQRIHGKLKQADVTKQVMTYAYHDNIEEALAVIGSASGVVASRFHALVLAWVLDCHVYPLIYSPKMTQVMADVGFEGDYTEIKKISTLNIQKVIRQLKDCPPIEIAEYSAKAEAHFLKLDERIPNDISFL